MTGKPVIGQGNRRRTPQTHDQRDGSLTASEIHRRFEAWADEQAVLTLCGFCDWRFEGTAAEGREAAAAHRLEQHPDAVQPKRRRHGKDAAIQAARAARAEREDGERLAKVERARARDALAAMDAGEPLEPVLEETAAVANPGVSGAAATPCGEPERAAVSSSYQPKPGSRSARVLAILSGGPQTVTEILAALGETTHGPLGFSLTDLHRRGMIVRLGRGVYGLPGATVPEREPQADNKRRPANATASAQPSREPSRSGTAATRTPAQERADLLQAMIDRERRFLDELEATLLADVLEEAA